MKKLALALGAVLALGLVARADDKVLVLDTPKEWKAQPQASMGSMGTKQTFEVGTAEGDKDAATITLYHFTSGVGSFEENTKRWAGQFEQDGKKVPVEKGKTDKVEPEAKGVTIKTFEVAGTFAPAAMPGAAKQDPKAGWKMIGAFIETPAGTWVVKFVGPEKSVDKFKDAVVKWLKSAKSEEAKK